MSLLEKINVDFLAAYKAKEMEKKDFLGFLKSEVLREGKNPDDAYIVGKFKSMRKKLVESESISDLESEVLDTYIPSQLSEEDLTEIIGDVFTHTTNTNMGTIMKHLMSEYAGQYDGKMASTIARGLLSKN
tara:strand:+ start:183884 stop:184276 length:393 start_codon:yes stop_codon:yes gene_type:complete